MYMKKRFYFIPILLSLILNNHVCAQIGFSLAEGQSKIEIPFKSYNNLIVIPVKLKNNTSLDLILDSSIEHTILTDKGVGDGAGLNYARKILLGKTPETVYYGFAAFDAQLSIAGLASTPEMHSILVLETDYLNLVSLAGSKVDGIIGYDIFKSFVVEIDNSQSNLILHDPKSFEKPKGFQSIPMTVKNRKPYANASIVYEDWQEKTKSFMLKTGASHALFFEDDSVEFHLPYKNIEIPVGQAFGGEIMGHLGRLRSLSLGRFEFEDPLATFAKPEVIAGQNTSQNRGSIGQGLLQRFNLIFDYHNGVLYLKKNPTNFDQSFEFDMSGVKIDVLNKPNYIFQVADVRSPSAASKAGMLIGDQIISINGEVLTIENYPRYLQLFHSKLGKKVSFVVKRGDQNVTIEYRLSRLI